MMTREQIEIIAEKCGVEVSYTEPGKGGFIIDSNDFLIKYFDTPYCNQKRYIIDDEIAFLAV